MNYPKRLHSSRIPVLGRLCVLVFSLLMSPAVVQAQFTYVTNNGSVTITGYDGPGGVIVIPNSTNGYTVTGIGDFAFQDDTNLTSVTISSSVTNIGVGPFFGCTSLTNISVNAGNNWYGSIGGVLLSFAGRPYLNTVVAYPAGLTNGTYIFPYSITNIAEYAFASCSSLTNMLVDVSSIGDFAFMGCTGLSSVTITNSPYFLVTFSIGEGAFLGCTSLTNVFISNAVTNVGDLAFAYCTNLTAAYFQTNAPPNDGTAFYGDPNAVVYYPPGTSGWGPTFGGAPTMAQTPAYDFQYSINGGSIAIQQYDGPPGSVVIPGAIDGYPVTILGLGANYPGENGVFPLNVTRVAIPNSVTNIEGHAFAGCGITNITIPGTVISIGQYAFAGCQNLISVTIPNGVPNIGAYTFFDCMSLATVTIPNSVTSIGLEAFQHCYCLTNFVIPSGVTNIGILAFNDCTALTNFSVDAANPSYSSLNGVLFDKAQDTLVYYPAGLSVSSYTVPNGVSSIAYQAFCGCAGPTNIIIPSSVTNIAELAFLSCHNLTSAYFQGNAPANPGGGAFNGDPITVYYLPGTTGWGTTFSGAPAVLWNPQATAFTTTENQFGFTMTGPTNATIVVEACTNLAAPVWIPISTNILTGGSSPFSDPFQANQTSRFYRFTAP